MAALPFNKWRHDFVRANVPIEDRYVCLYAVGQVVLTFRVVPRRGHSCGGRLVEHLLLGCSAAGETL